METIKHPQLLVLLTVLSVLFSQVLALPLSEGEVLRKVRHDDFEGVYSPAQGQLGEFTDQIDADSIIEKRASDIPEDHRIMKRELLAKFSKAFDRFLKKLEAFDRFLKKAAGTPPEQ